MRATCFLLVTLSGCSKIAPQAISAQVASPERPSNNSGRYLAIEHSLQITAEEPKIASVHEAAQAACRDAAESQCVVLRSRLNTGKNASAEIRFRAKPAGIQKLIAMFSTQGVLINQSMSAEDLAGPIEDAAKKLALLRDYQSKLEALRGRASSDIEALIKVNQELSQVVSQIESLSGTRAQLSQRVDTEILSVSITSAQGKSWLRPVSNALSNFGANLAEGTSSTINAIAYLMPFTFVLLGLIWAGRKFWWRWRKPQIASEK